MDPMEEYALTLTEDDTFDPSECDMIVEKFVCGVCHGPLNIIDIPYERRVLIVCIEHGNVCNCGRVTHSTVGIELERSYKKYYSAIRALPDLWGELANEGFEREHAFRVIKDYVCAICGAKLIPYTRPNDKNTDVCCTRHGNVNICGYVKKQNFKFDFQRERAWNQSHRKNYSNQGA